MPGFFHSACFLSFIRDVACISTSCFFIAEQHSVVCVDHNFSPFHLLMVNEHLCCFYLLALIVPLSCTMNICLQVFVEWASQVAQW